MGLIIYDERDIVMKKINDKEVEDFGNTQPKHFYEDFHQDSLDRLRARTMDELIRVYNHEVDATRAHSWVGIRPVFLDALNQVCLERGLPPFYTAGEVGRCHAKKKIKLEGIHIVETND